MAEGFSGGPPNGPVDTTVEPRGAAAFIDWLTRTRRGRCSAAAVIGAIVLASITAWHAFVSPIVLATPDAKSWFVAGLAILWLPLLLLMLNSPDNMARGPQIGLPLITLALLAALATFVVADRMLSARILTDESDRPRFAQMSAFFVLLCATFIPRIWNAILFAIYKERDLRQREEGARRRAAGDTTATARAAELEGHQREHDDAESFGAFVATVTVIGIGVLAWLAGGWSQGSDGLRNIVGIAIAGGVIGLFAVVIFLDRIAELAPVRAASHAVRGFSRRVSWLAAFYNAIDTALVRIGAHVAGTEHHKTRSRYTILAGTLGSLAVLAWFLPAPLGLIPAAIGFVLALSVSRLWSWVEEDRNLASITSYNPDAPKRVGFREDFRDETLLGLIFVLVLVPIAMMQADTGQLFGQPLFDGDNKSDLGVWLGYFGFELAKALPIVDWADIYHLQPGDDLLKPHEAIGMHAVFAARATVDIVLIASLLQAIGVASRNRQQKALFAADHIDRLDELVEKEELNRAVSRPVDDWFPGPVDFRNYDKARLKEIHSVTDDQRIKDFIKEIFDRKNLELDPALLIFETMSIKHRDESELYLGFEAVKAWSKFAGRD